MQLFRSALYRIACDAQNRKIVLCGCNEQSEVIYKKLSLLGIPVDSFLEKNPNIFSFCGIQVKSYEDIMLEDLGSLRIIISDNNQVEGLEQLGLKRGENFRTINYNESSRMEFHLDPNIGYNSVTEAIPGFKCFGEKSSEEFIVTLGNSTSDPKQYAFKCWSEVLAEKLEENGKNIKVLCGAVSGHMSPQELIKLIRDVVPLHPAKVICYEGFQDINNTFRDISYPFVSKYQKQLLQSLNMDKWIDIYYTKGYTYGVNGQCSPYILWKNSMRMMHAICREFGIEFIGILQPSIYNKLHCLGKKDWEVVLHYELRDDLLKWFEQFFEEYQRDTERYDYLYDYTNIFDEIDGVYIDNCHIYEQGNRLIAEKIYKDFF